MTLDGRVILTAIVAVAALVHLAVGYRRLQWRRPWAALMVGGAIAAATWIPEGWRDGAFTSGAAILGLMVGEGLFARLGAAVMLGGVVLLVGRAIPGGVTVAILAILALVAVFEVRAALRRLRRLQRARELKPGEEAAGEVEIGGRVAARRPLSLPGDPKRKVAAWGLVVASEGHRSNEPIEIATAAGPVLVDPSQIEWELSHADAITDEQARAALADAGCDGVKLTDGQLVTLSWLELDSEVYVVGRPSWRPVPAGMAAGYRASPLAPVFAGKGTFLADRGEEQLAQAARGRLWGWAIWGPVCLAVAIHSIVVAS